MLLHLRWALFTAQTLKAGESADSLICQIDILVYHLRMKKDFRIYFFGDSFVNGTNDPLFLGWAGRICKNLSALHSITYYNLGIRRDTSKDVLDRIHSELSKRILPETEILIFISFGVNDTDSDSGEQRVALKDSLENADKIIFLAKIFGKIIFVGPPPVVDTNHNMLIQNLNKTLKTKIISGGEVFIDIFSELSNDKKWFEEISLDDGYHPREYGYNKIAEIIHRNISL